ncbi:MAG: TPR end-of-group domain-containing protein [Longimicrobiales bacterium]
MPRLTRQAPPLLLLLALLLPPETASPQDFPEGGAEAVSEFAEGMSLYAAGEYREALEHLYRAHELDEGFVVPLFFAALCEGNLGTAVPRDSLILIVLEKKDQLSPYYRYRAESYFAQISGDRDTALDLARKAARTAPGSKAWYNTAYIAVRNNRPAEARSALLTLNPEKEPMKGWAGYYGELARANDALGRHEEVLQNAAAMREAFPEARAPFWWEVNAYGAMGDLEGLEGVFEAAAATPATGAGNTVGTYLTLAGAELRGHGHTQAGVEMYHRAADWYENAGDAVSGLAHRQWYALALMGAGRFADAKAEADRMLASNPNNVWFHGMAGLAAAREGDRERARKETAYMVSLAPDRVPAWLPGQMAYMLAAEGRAEEAVASLESAMNQGWAFNAWWHRDPAFDLIRDHPAFQELIRPKG